MLRPVVSVVAIGLLLGFASSSEARITRLEIQRTDVAFGGQQFGNMGAYEHLVGQAIGEIDPADPKNAIIQDLSLAPRNEHGMVEYATSVEILKPKDMTHSNRVLLFDVANRGNKITLAALNSGIAPIPAQRNALSTAGDGYLMREG